MSSLHELYATPRQFAGKVRLFPLPNLVLFPNVLQLLHIFEPRYRGLVEEAIESDRLMAVGTLSPGWESDYEGRPPVGSMACLGRIATFHRFEDGRFNLLLAGVQRVELIRELPPKKLFREFEARLIEDEYPADLTGQRVELRKRLLEGFNRCSPKLPDSLDGLMQMLGSDVPLGALTDVIAYTMQLDQQLKQQLLHEVNVDRRASILLDQLAHDSLSEPPEGLSPPKASREGGNDFPPRFSLN